MNFSEREIKAVWPNPGNPRKDIKADPSFPGLVESIRNQGILQPLLVNRYGCILAGHRRYEAALELGLATVPVVELDDEHNHVLIPIIDNLQRTDLPLLTVAEYLKECKDQGLTLVDMEAVTGISASTISKYIRLANAPQEVKDRVANDEIPLGAAIELLRHDDAFVHEVIAEPRLTKEIVRKRARSLRAPREADDQRPTVHTARCSIDKTAHLQYARNVIRELLQAAPDEAFKIRYARWLQLIETDLADTTPKNQEHTFRGAVNEFMREPLGNRPLGWKAS